MNIRFEAVALTGNYRDQHALDSIGVLARHLLTHQIRVQAAAAVGSADLPQGVSQVPDDELARDVKLIIAVGGDGTMLFAARQAAVGEIPLLGINRGRLGFLADVSPGDMLDHLDRILTGDYDTEQRMLLQAEIASGTGSTACGVALNDVVVKRQDTGRMLEFQTHVDGRYVNTHGGDGFIVATPTGSTAYALSCGGPIVSPRLDAIVLAPICPHTLSDRPIVIPATSVTEVTLREEHTDIAEVSCDGNVTGELKPGDRVRVAAAKQRVELIHPTGYDYYQILRTKLHWGRGNRISAPGQ